MVYLVTYDLNQKSVGFYEALFAALKSFLDHKHIQGSVWLIHSNYSASEIRVKLRKHIHADDSLLVVQVSDYSGWMNKSVWDWLKTKFESATKTLLGS